MVSLVISLLSFLILFGSSLFSKNQLLVLLIFSMVYFLINLYFYFFIFWLCWVFVSVRGLSLVAASGGHSSSHCAGLSLSQPLISEHRLQTPRLSSCGSRAQLLCAMWDPPRPGLEPVSLHWQADSQPLCHQGSPLLFF